MPEESRTERATPYRRRKLREEGHVAKSTDLVASLSLLVITVSLYLVGPQLYYSLLSIFYTAPTLSVTEHPTLLRFFVEKVSPYILSLMVLSTLTVILAHLGQFGVVFTLKPLRFRWERLNPVEGIKRLLSLTTLFELFKNTLKIGILLFTVYLFLRTEIYRLMESVLLPLHISILDVMGLTLKLFIILGTLAIIMASLDLLYRRWDYERKIRMTKQEVKEEYKQHEGNPMVKGAIRKRMRQLAKGRMIKEVPKATVVITNPTHVAVALRYDPSGGDRAPVVLAKGVGQIAERIINVAREYGVPIVRKEELARSLYRWAEVGEEIPPRFYRAVAEIIAFILWERRRAYHG
ncbi:flagellar biosynthetic protein FlhB [Thermocrinis albus DSM 14484]|uniref:Flagellar biosynthetic protein FlhB n=1 Tax=Thermocrinis albus (strain DSM 14484 / JCM 11386 / HI 11/12) TaxID=638303 RepID=D3SLY5_THEAH|nr:flagellar biosynthesis protein FlhB [Thermocrinis albus]ADC89765.1 flagellar biosynthetic protein FlhB [Thermocrinis albus DSM 14484]